MTSKFPFPVGTFPCDIPKIAEEEHYTSHRFDLTEGWCKTCEQRIVFYDSKPSHDELRKLATQGYGCRHYAARAASKAERAEEEAKQNQAILDKFLATKKQ